VLENTPNTLLILDLHYKIRWERLKSAPSQKRVPRSIKQHFMGKQKSLLAHNLYLEITKKQFKLKTRLFALKKRHN
jgi:hypothetical protein